MLQHEIFNIKKFHTTYSVAVPANKLVKAYPGNVAAIFHNPNHISAEAGVVATEEARRHALKKYIAGAAVRR